eukprot:EG_transcript_8741
MAPALLPTATTAPLPSPLLLPRLPRTPHHDADTPCRHQSPQPPSLPLEREECQRQDIRRRACVLARLRKRHYFAPSPTSDVSAVGAASLEVLPSADQVTASSAQPTADASASAAIPLPVPVGGFDPQMADQWPALHMPWSVASEDDARPRRPDSGPQMADQWPAMHSPWSTVAYNDQDGSVDWVSVESCPSPSDVVRQQYVPTPPSAGRASAARPSGFVRAPHGRCRRTSQSAASARPSRPAGPSPAHARFRSQRYSVVERSRPTSIAGASGGRLAGVPGEVQVLMLSFLPLEAVPACSLVCRDWLQLIDVLQLRASLLARLPLERLRALLRPRVLRVIRHAEHARNITDQLLYADTTSLKLQAAELVLDPTLLAEGVAAVFNVSSIAPMLHVTPLPCLWMSQQRLIT